jgi:hypothetical protein
VTQGLADLSSRKHAKKKSSKSVVARSKGVSVEAMIYAYGSVAADLSVDAILAYLNDPLYFG